MKIGQIFKKDIKRPINGVIKVGDESDSSVWQELDEYVLTGELRRHFQKFFGVYLDALDNETDPISRSRTGVWVSGFFGSGKSHFIKNIAHLLANQNLTNPDTGETRSAVEFFEDKINDAMFFGDVERAVRNPPDVILFNIDSKAESGNNRDSILQVFMRVLNEKLGYCAEYPFLADIERKMDEDGNYERFQQVFERIHGAPWKEERDAFALRRDDTIAALSEACSISTESAARILDEGDRDYLLSVENFAKKVKKYLDREGKHHRLIFVVDEVGQFIGSDTHLMLNLQTIVENLGTICEGRAWVVVTSQEELDSVLGNVTGAKSNDFSKIQGRFSTRISLSSSNTDEVIQRRLLEKTDDANAILKSLFAQKGDVIKNQLAFSNDGVNLRNFRDADEFAADYPFAPYHYQLVQAVFESIRKAGATGLHLARGERSMLDAFQMGANSIGDDEIGRLVPFYEFYPAVESFLDTAVKRTIDQSSENEGLELFDGKILRVLFLIRYVEIIKPNVENLTTLAITKVDDDRIALKQKIEASLARLEKQTLISRNGDLYYFLTNEERDIGREIKAVDVSGADIVSELSKLLFTEVVPDSGKFRYQINKKDFQFNRYLDGIPYAAVQDQNLNLAFISPINDDYDALTEQKSVLDSSERVLIKLSPDDKLAGEVRDLIQNERYRSQKMDASATESTKRILSDKATENQQRRQRIVSRLKVLCEEGLYFAAGQKLGPDDSTIPQAQEYLVKNLFTKLRYLNAPADNAESEVKAILLADDVGQASLALDAGQPNALALDEIRQWVKLRSDNNIKVTLDEIAKNFERVPYGWRDWDTVLLVAKLFAKGEFSARHEATNIEPKAAVESFTKTGKWKTIVINKRRATDPAKITAVKSLAHEVFGKAIGEIKETDLLERIRGECRGWKEKLTAYEVRAESKDYPGEDEIKSALKVVNGQLGIADPYEFFDRFVEDAAMWREAAGQVSTLTDFYENQISIWKKMLDRYHDAYADNRTLLDPDPDAGPALERLDAIRESDAPYGFVHEINPLLATIDGVNERIVSERRAQVSARIENRIELIKARLDEVNANSDLRHDALEGLQTLKTAYVATETSIQKLSFLETERTEALFNDALELIERKTQAFDVPQTTPEKPTKIVKPAMLCPKPFLESESDVEAFIDRLKSELTQIISQNGRIRIQ